MAKQYGKERTHLSLSATAFNNYSNSDFVIYEEETEDGYTYTIDGGLYSDDLSEKDINDFFEQLEEVEDTLESILTNHSNDSIRLKKQSRLVKSGWTNTKEQTYYKKRRY